MPTLFVAVDLPPATTNALARIQPPPTRGVRLTEPGQMHLTIHYLGEAHPGRTAQALSTVAVPAFSLAVEGAGQFRSDGGAVTLWAGVCPCAELLRLHSAVAAALSQEGFKPEARPYSPHITLARCEPEVASAVAERFLAEQTAFCLEEVSMTTFGLYASTRVGTVPRYQCVRSYSLLSGGTQERT